MAYPAGTQQSQSEAHENPVGVWLGAGRQISLVPHLKPNVRRLSRKESNQTSTAQIDKIFTPTVHQSVNTVFKPLVKAILSLHGNTVDTSIIMG